MIDKKPKEGEINDMWMSRCNWNFFEETKAERINNNSSPVYVLTSKNLKLKQVMLGKAQDMLKWQFHQKNTTFSALTLIVCLF